VVEWQVNEGCTMNNLQNATTKPDWSVVLSKDTQGSLRPPVQDQSGFVVSGHSGRGEVPMVPCSALFYFLGVVSGVWIAMAFVAAKTLVCFFHEAAAANAGAQRLLARFIADDD
jgi:hypothetical protein